MTLAAEASRTVVPAAPPRALGFWMCLAPAIARDCGRCEWVMLDRNRPAIDVCTGMGAQMTAEWRIERVAGKALARLAEQA